LAVTDKDLLPLTSTVPATQTQLVVVSVAGGVLVAISDVSQGSLAELMSLQGRIAVVTGGAVGIGYATARRFAQAGARVLIGDLRDAADAAHVLAAESGAQVVGCPLDVSDADSIRGCADQAVETFGRLDIWVNNAGIYPSVPFLEMSEDDWDRVIDVNLRGSFLGAREAAIRMVRGGHEGVIVNVASTAGFKAGGPGVAHYVASKHAVRGLTKSLAVELGPHGIRALAVAPTLIDTPGIAAGRQAFEQAGLGDLLDSYAGRLPLGRIGVADDVARVALFCASDLSLFMTGSTLLVDGGDLAL
jgi:NAD(P)-dependent dehydrogenase (short-subunit alcohol dehydrogenase family)